MDVTDVTPWFRLFMDVTNDDEPPSSPYLRHLRVGFFFGGGGFVGIGGLRVTLGFSIQLRCHLHEERDALKPLGTQIFFFDVQ